MWLRQRIDQHLFDAVQHDGLHREVFREQSARRAQSIGQIHRTAIRHLPSRERRDVFALDRKDRRDNHVAPLPLHELEVPERRRGPAIGQHDRARRQAVERRLREVERCVVVAVVDAAIVLRHEKRRQQRQARGDHRRLQPRTNVGSSGGGPAQDIAHPRRSDADQDAERHVPGRQVVVDVVNRIRLDDDRIEHDKDREVGRHGRITPGAHHSADAREREARPRQIVRRIRPQNVNAIGDIDAPVARRRLAGEEHRPVRVPVRRSRPRKRRIHFATDRQVDVDAEPNQECDHRDTDRARRQAAPTQHEQQRRRRCNEHDEPVIAHAQAECQRGERERPWLAVTPPGEHQPRHERREEQIEAVRCRPRRVRPDGRCERERQRARRRRNQVVGEVVDDAEDDGDRECREDGGHEVHAVRGIAYWQERERLADQDQERIARIVRDAQRRRRRHELAHVVPHDGGRQRCDVDGECERTDAGRHEQRHGARADRYARPAPRACDTTRVRCIKLHTTRRPTGAQAPRSSAHTRARSRARSSCVSRDPQVLDPAFACPARRPWPSSSAPDRSSIRG